ncbi:hypothetical protein EYF80_043512 [Liparis tanakae]|uniref:Uncharacterized protein n=1 Tax=Liparis tanakae TaxID=230148 RepID=A0A4Z2G0C8_9TELE|nr:hypothetical protein EYF80_043512 [Liparis tanakae]
MDPSQRAPRGGVRVSLWCRGEHAEEGRASLSSACTRGLRLRLQAELGRGGGESVPRRRAAIFNRTALVGLWTPNAATREHASEGTGRWRRRRETDGMETTSPGFRTGTAYSTKQYVISR